jgi:predicted transcriptional regulator
MKDDLDPLRVATSRIVSAWLGTHDISTTAIPDLIRAVHGALAPLTPDREPAPRGRPSLADQPPGRPAVDISESVFADHLVCLEDGKSVKMLKRHLRTAHGLSPAQYRAKWGLPASYPIVAPNYANTRSTLARQSGLGKRR